MVALTAWKPGTVEAADTNSARLDEPVIVNCFFPNCKKRTLRWKRSRGIRDLKDHARTHWGKPVLNCQHCEAVLLSSNQVLVYIPSLFTLLSFVLFAVLQSLQKAPPRGKASETKFARDCSGTFYPKHLYRLVRSLLIPSLSYHSVAVMTEKSSLTTNMFCCFSFESSGTTAAQAAPTNKCHTIDLWGEVEDERLLELIGEIPWRYTHELVEGPRAIAVE
ncbi:hypothetical protein Y032_0002g810 [Ancylostoma ceylanicum]|nr:hypothetical protein Y032_0002g810 [Ancylostoma ceylanicum]